MRKHPVIFGMLILVALGISFYFFFYKAGLHSGQNKGFSLNDKIGVICVEGIIADSKEITDQHEFTLNEGQTWRVVCDNRGFTISFERILKNTSSPRRRASRALTKF